MNSNFIVKNNEFDYMISCNGICPQQPNPANACPSGTAICADGPLLSKTATVGGAGSGEANTIDHCVNGIQSNDNMSLNADHNYISNASNEGIRMVNSNQTNTLTYNTITHSGIGIHGLTNKTLLFADIEHNPVNTLNYGAPTSMLCTGILIEIQSPSWNPPASGITIYDNTIDKTKMAIWL